jgi:hypothetical protein
MGNDQRETNNASQTIPVLISSIIEQVDCYSLYAAQQGIVRHVAVKRHPYEVAFALTDYKLQGRTLPKLIVSVCKRQRIPWMSLQAFYVLISRTTSMAGLRLLQYDRAGIDSVRTQMPDLYLYAWERGYDGAGMWKNDLAVTALRNIRDSRFKDKQASVIKNKAQSFTITNNSPNKRGQPTGQNSPSPSKRQRFSKCSRCNNVGHNKNHCPLKNKDTRSFITQTPTHA